MIIDMSSTPGNEILSSSPPPYDPTPFTQPQDTFSLATPSHLMTDEKAAHLHGQYLDPLTDSGLADIHSPHYQDLRDENNMLRKHNAALRIILFPTLIILIFLFTCFVFISASVLRSRRLLLLETLKELVVMEKKVAKMMSMMKVLGALNGWEDGE